jgi:elongation factor P
VLDWTPQVSLLVRSPTFNRSKEPEMNANDLRPGMVIRHNNELFSIHKAEHRTPGNLRAFVQARMRNLRTGALIDHRFRSTDAVERANLDETEMQYLYSDGDSYHFMNTSNYEQVHLHKDVLGDRALYLVPDVMLKVVYYEGRPVDVQLPATVDLKVVETEPGIKGASATNVTKPAKLETGLIVNVPPFIDEGEYIRIDTAEGTYLERAK